MASAKDTAGVPAPPPLIFLAGLLIGVVIELAAPVDGPAIWIRIAGAIVGVIGFLALDSSALQAFRRARTPAIPFLPTTALVTTGWPYGYTRNPMYLGMALLYCGLALGFSVIWAFAVLPFVIFVIDRFVIAREEPYL